MLTPNRAHSLTYELHLHRTRNCIAYLGKNKNHRLRHELPLFCFMQWLNNELRVSLYTLFVDWAVDRGAHFAVPGLHRTAAFIHNQAGRQYHSPLYTTLPIVNAPFCHVLGWASTALQTA